MFLELLFKVGLNQSEFRLVRPRSPFFVQLKPFYSNFDLGVKLKNQHLRNYDLWAISIMENGEFVSTVYLQCDHEQCISNPKKHFYRAGKLNSKGIPNYDKAQILRHESRNHTGPREILRAATLALIESSLPLDLLERPGFKQLLGMLNDAYINGFPRNQIERNIR